MDDSNAPRLSHEGNTPDEQSQPKRKRMWTMGIMSDAETDEVPGSILLMSKYNKHNAPLGLDNDPAGASSTSLHSQSSSTYRSRAMFGRRKSFRQDEKRTKDGKIILDPQPDDSHNDPLNWPVIRRDAALLSLGFYCMVGGGMTTVIAPAFTNVAATFDVTIPQVALTTGLYMMGLGLGSVIASPTAIAFGKRPVYLVASILFVLTSVWCALAPNYESLVIARVFQGMSVSPVECLPSATIAEIYFLHERAYRLGIYTLLLLGGKNLIPLVSAGITQSLGWRWVFWIVAIVVGFCFCLLFFFVPETFWDRTPEPHRPHRSLRRPSFSKMSRLTSTGRFREKGVINGEEENSNGDDHIDSMLADAGDIAGLNEKPTKHPRFALDGVDESHARDDDEAEKGFTQSEKQDIDAYKEDWLMQAPMKPPKVATVPSSTDESEVLAQDLETLTTDLKDIPARPSVSRGSSNFSIINEKVHQYTQRFRSQPPKTLAQKLQPYSGRLNHDNWFRVAFRPFVLFAYPAILWSAAVYALSVGWLIILSESVATIFRSKDTYNLSAIQSGLVFISPFIGGVLGTAVAGKVSDYLVRYIARRNGGVYEPEFRLFMGIPVAITTSIGLMGYGWSAQIHDNIWVPIIFFGVISFGCTLGSTTAITFAVDSYRQFAGEALVTLNFSKNIFDGLVFSLFFNNWLDSDGSKLVFLCLGGIQLFFLLWTIPMYIYGKRLRMWTVRKKMMDKF